MRQFEEEPPIEQAIGWALTETDAMLGVAESCTGGLISSLITDVPGASAYLDRALVTYSNQAKQQELGVSRESLDAHGAVSEAVAREMATGVRDVSATTWGLATTGIAGPTGGTDDKPVGTAFVAVAYAAPWGSGGSFVTVDQLETDGNRLEIKERIARTALRKLHETIRSVQDE